jgi:hypothetical protein
VCFGMLYIKKTLVKSGGSLIFECEIHNRDIKNACKHSTFLKDILIALHSIKNDKVN